MSFIKTGNCSRCGSPIWSPATWNTVTPPPNHFSCNCNGKQVVVATTQKIINNSSNIEFDELSKEVRSMIKIIADLTTRIEKLENETKKDKPVFLKD